MALFDVFVEGATSAAPDAAGRLAEVMQQRYGLPATDLMARMAKGRFRVKGNIDEATANTYARDLEAIGARVSISEVLDSDGSRPSSVSLPPTNINVVSRASGASGSSLPPATRGRVSTPAVGSALPPREGAPRPSPSVLPAREGSSPVRTGGSSLPPATRAPVRSGGSSLPPATAGRVSTSTPPFASGLSAAFGSEPASAMDLGAIEQSEALSLATLDGNDDAAPKADITFSPSVAIRTAAKTATAKPERPKDIPLDLFAPPDADAAKFEVEIAADEIAAREKKRASVPLATVSEPAFPPTPVPASPLLKRKSAPSLSPPAHVAVIAPEPRGRFAAGVVLAVIVGFLPAHIVASMREDAAFAKIDSYVDEVQAQASSPNAPVAYAELDAFRSEQERRKHSARRNIALLALAMWAAGTAGAAYVWFRRIPWDRG